jgi:hypothetical protein
MTAPKPNLSQQYTPRHYSAKIWPDLTFTIGNSSPVRTDRGKNPLKGITKDGFGVSFENRQADHEADKEFQGEILLKLWDMGKLTPEKAAAIASRINNPHMGLSDASNSHKSVLNLNQNRSRRGQKGISTNGKRMVRSAGVLLEQRFQRHNLTFFTGTLPELDDEARLLICQRWDQVCRKFHQELGRELERHGLSKAFAYVTEIQEKRFYEWGQVYLHVHTVFQGRRNRKSAWAITKEKAREIWNRIISNELGQDIDSLASTRVEQPRKSLEAEMGKYLGKGASVIADVIEAGLGDYLPTAWWGASRPLKAAVRKAVIRSSSDLANFLSGNLDSLAHAGLLKFRRIYGESENGAEIPIGVAGWFTSRDALNEFLDVAGHPPMFKPMLKAA